MQSLQSHVYTENVTEDVHEAQVAHNAVSSTQVATDAGGPIDETDPTAVPHT